MDAVVFWYIVHFMVTIPENCSGRPIHSLFAPGSESANRTLANSLPGTFVPWPIRSLALLLLAFSLPGTFAPLERNGPGTFVPWNFRTPEYSLPGTFAPWSFRSLLVRDIICDTGYILMILTFK